MRLVALVRAGCIAMAAAIGVGGCSKGPADGTEEVQGAARQSSTLEAGADGVGEPGKGTSFSAATFNVRLARGDTPWVDERLAALADPLSDLDADFLCLQEVWQDQDLDQLAKELSPVYPELFFVRTTPPSQSAASTATLMQQGRNGLVLFSKYPLENRGHLSLDSSLYQRVVLAATARIGDASVEVYCTQLSADLHNHAYGGKHGSWTAEQVYQADQIITYVQNRSPKGPALILADLNAGPTLEGASAASEQAYERFAEAGILDLYAAAGKEGCTLCSENPLHGRKGQPARFDHIMGWMTGAPPAAARLALSEPIVTIRKALDNTDTIRIPLSQHYAVVVDMVLAIGDGGER